MSWRLGIRNEEGDIPEVRSTYIGGTQEADPVTGLPIVRPCSISVTYNYGRLLRIVGMPDALRALDGLEINPILITELVLKEGTLAQMCTGREASNNYWDGKDPYNVLKLVRWLREASEELGDRGGKFTFRVF